MLPARNLRSPVFGLLDLALFFFGFEVPGTKAKVGNPELIFFRLYRDSSALAFMSLTWPGRGSLAVYRPGSSDCRC